MTKSEFKTIGIFGKYRDSSVSDSVSALSSYLENRGIRVLLGDNTATDIKGVRAAQIPQGDIKTIIDLAVVLGGDGTMLSVARDLAAYSVPVVGVNMGRLGFLTDISARTMIPELDRILAGDYHIENRLLLRLEINGQDVEEDFYTAFNDIVVSKGESARLIELQILVDDEFVTNIRGDGIIVATPSGSTAYALSAGGPILHPQLPAIELVPVSPHGLAHRPIVLHSSSKVEISTTSKNGSRVNLAVDGHFRHQLSSTDKIHIRAARRVVKFIRTVGHNHYAALRSKLGWGAYL